MPQIENEWSDQSWLTSNKEFYHSPSNLMTNQWVDFKSTGMHNALDSFLELNTKQLSVLQPSFKVYKRKNKKWLPINAPININAAGKLDVTSIKSVNITRGERKIGEINISFTVDFYASSYEAFTKPRNGVALIDLIRRDGEAVKDPHVSYTKDHTTKIEVGWSALSGKDLKALKSKGFLSDEESEKLISFTSKSRISLIGTLIEHTIDLDSDGSLSIKIEFKGIFEANMENPRANILFGFESDLNKQLTALLKEMDETKNAQRRGRLQKKYDAALKTYATAAYSQILAQIKKRKRLYAVDVDEETIHKVTNHVNIEKLKEDEAKRKAAQVADASARSHNARLAAARSRGGPSMNLSVALTPERGTTPGMSPNLSHLGSIYKGKVFINAPKVKNKPYLVKPVATTPANNTQPAPSAAGVPATPTSGTPKRTIYYTPMASIIDYFLENGLAKIADDDGKVQGFYPRVEIGDFRFERAEGTGMVSLTGASTSKNYVLYRANIGSIPVSVTTFQAWFTKFVVSQRRTTITIRQFITSLLQNLIVEAYSGFKNINFAANLWNAQMNVFPYDKGTKIKINCINGGQHGRYPIFKIGGSQAILKKVSFDRQNAPKHFAEAQQHIAAYKKTGITRFVYNAKIEIVGNAFFSHGQLIEIDPSAFVPISIDAQSLGFGGNYLITGVNTSFDKNGFVTHINATWESALKYNNNPLLDQEKQFKTLEYSKHPKGSGAMVHTAQPPARPPPAPPIVT